jgi:hypothetical protein
MRHPSILRSSLRGLALGAALLAGSALATAGAAQAGAAPGTAPAGKRAAAAQKAPDPVTAASGLNVFYRAFGKYRLSVDAAGSNDLAHIVSVKKPANDAVVEKAFLMAASYGGVTINNGDVSLDGNGVTWIDGVYNDISSQVGYFHSVLADVTNIVKPKVDASGAGVIDFELGEPVSNFSIDGEVLAVVFRTPSDAEKRTVVLMFGGQQLAGDRFELTLAEPIDPKVRGSFANMGLGISFSAQPTGQYSIVDVNGQRLSTSAGGQDDGSLQNGALITAGGLDDLKANPVDPNAQPSDTRTDDEMYNLLKFLDSKTAKILVDTYNPSDDDNIFFAWFELSAKGDVNKDTDGDGLLDSWETSGYDHDGDGTVDVPIHKRGADPKRKDIFIAYAWMEASPSEAASHQPSKAVLKAVMKAFKSAPVTNPDGSTGISLHFKSLGGVPHDDDLNPAWTEFDAIMNPLVSEAERRIYHRMISAHGYDGTGSSGLSRGIPASDFIESLGLFPSNPGTLTQRAGTIMHELGHNLGLRHGGVDHENYKPNHLSVMSYHHQLDWLLHKDGAKLDYERFDLHDLDENALNEKIGLTREGGDAPLRPYGTRWFSTSVAKSKPQGANAKIDWNNNIVNTDNPVAVDLNDNGSLSILRARYPEWDNIVYDGGEIGAGEEPLQSLMTSPEDLRELSWDDYVAMQAKKKK